MNDLENLLGKGPIPIAPADLGEKIIAAIRLPVAIPGHTDWTSPQPWFKRWLPALSFAMLLLTCLVVIGVQSNLLSTTQRDNQTLRGQTQNLDSLRQANIEVQRLRNENAELERLQKDSVELQRLRGEISQLQSQADGLAKLRADNEKLKLAAAPLEQKDFFAEAQAKAERIKCCNNLKQACLAVRIWQGDNNELCPNDLISMTNELSNWRVLQCPSDHAHTVSGWEDVAAGNTSYLYLGAGCKEKDNPNTVIFECPIHRNVGLLDGSVQQLSEKAYAEDIKTINGRKVLVWNK